MKKLFTLLATLALCLSLAACGGPDKQPAVNAFNSASGDIDSCPADLGDMLNQLSDQLTTKGEQLQNDDLSQEDLDAMTEWFGEVQTWADDTLAELGA